MSDATKHGRFCWYELMTSDTEAAIAFYTKVIGWGTTPWEGGGMACTMWTAGKTPLGSVMAIPDDAAAAGAPPHWAGYVAVEDIEATVAKAKSLGAELMVGPMEIEGAGVFAVLRDPQGAVFSIFFDPKDSPVDDALEELRFSWNELLTTDHDAAFEFYSALFGWKKAEAVDMGEPGIYQIFSLAEGRQIGGMFNKMPEIPAPPHWLFYILVADIDQALDAVRASGGTVHNGPMEVPGGSKVAQCSDPQGAFFALHSKG